MIDGHPLLEPLLRVAHAAGQIALSYYGRVTLEVKDDQSPVTLADREVEAFLRQELHELDPDAAFVGEESTARGAAEPRSSAERSAQHETARGAPQDRPERVWVVDPVDGTAAFLGQLDTFAVCIGQLRRGQPYAGVVRLPALDQTFLAVVGEGAWWRTPRGTVALDGASWERHSAQVRCFLAPSNAHRDYRIRYPGKVRSFGSTAYHFLLVARGVGVGAVSRSHIWDYAAAAAVLLQSGGVMRYLDGTAVDWVALLDGRCAGQAVLGAPVGEWDALAKLVQRPG